MSLTSASGGGGVTPGWYTDPHDPRQLRWWSGEGWTEHVSPGSGEPQVAAQAAAEPVAAAQPVAAQPVASEPVAAEGVAAQDAPLPSRRALRDPATEAVESAESALAAQAAAQQADQQAALAAQAQADQAAAAQAQADQAAAAQAAQAQVDQQAAFAAQQQAAPVQSAEPVQSVEPVQLAEPAQPAEPVQPVEPAQPLQPAQPEQLAPAAQPVPAAQPELPAPVAAQQPSAPVPTLPVAPTSFLEQQGYEPMDAAPADPNAWSQPAPAAQPNAWDQPVQPEQALPPVQAAQPNAWNQPVQPEQTLPPVQAAQPNAWNQPVQPTAAPTQPAWGGTAAAPAEGMDNLFGTAAAGTAVAPGAQASQWGLATPEPDSRRGAAVATEVAGSSSFWGWLIAISPILAAGSIMYVLLTVKPELTAWPFEAAVAAPYLLVLLFALGDRAVLLQLGHTQPRSPAWALLSAPVYLIMRASETRREDGSGTTLTLVWFISFLVAIGAIVGYGFLTHHALFAGLPT